MSCFFPLFFRRRMTTATTKVFWTNWNWKKRMKTSSLLWSNRSTVAARTAMSWKSWDSARTSWHKGISTSNDGNSSCGYIAFFFLLPLKRADWHFRSRQSCGNGSRWNWRCDPSCWSPIPTATSIIWMRWCRWLAKSTTRSSRHSSVRCIIDLQVEIPERSGRDCRQDKKKKEEEFARAWEIPWRFRATATLIQKIPLVDSGSWSWVEQKQQQNGEENKRNRNEKKKSFFFLWHFLVYLLALSGTSFFFLPRSAAQVQKFQVQVQRRVGFHYHYDDDFLPPLGLVVAPRGRFFFFPFAQHNGESTQQTPSLSVSFVSRPSRRFSPPWDSTLASSNWGSVPSK